MSDQVKEVQTEVVDKQEVELSEGAERTRPCKAFVPRADIFETDDSLVIVADMPGVDENTIDITLEKNVLSLKGTVEFVQPESFSLAYAEYEIGDYERSFTLSDEIDRDRIEATLSDGVLRIFLAKAGPAKTRKISVKSA